MVLFLIIIIKIINSVISFSWIDSNILFNEIDILGFMIFGNKLSYSFIMVDTTGFWNSFLQPCF